jgi:hypothetical protein
MLTLTAVDEKGNEWKVMPVIDWDEGTWHYTVPEGYVRVAGQDVEAGEKMHGSVPLAWLT